MKDKPQPYKQTSKFLAKTPSSIKQEIESVKRLYAFTEITNLKVTNLPISAALTLNHQIIRVVRHFTLAIPAISR